MKNQSLSQKKYINGLKGLACLFIMLAHFLGIYKYAQHFTPNMPLLDFIIHSPFSFLINEEYWLYLFFVISGYLVAKSEVNTIQDVILKVINRFFRFAFPILFSYIVIYIIYSFWGFHTVETTPLFQCDWFQNYYTEKYSIKNVLLGPYDILICGNSTFNGPYWVLRNMFISSIIIYLLKFCHLCAIKSNYEKLYLSALVIITFASAWYSTIVSACFIGMFISFYEGTNIVQKDYFVPWILINLMLLYFLPKTLLSSCFFAGLIIFIPRIEWIDNILSSKVCSFLGKISWGIYSFHWPLICSVGVSTMIVLYTTLGLRLSYAIAFLIVLVLTFILAITFYYSFEKLASYLTKKINDILSK